MSYRHEWDHDGEVAEPHIFPHALDSRAFQSERAGEILTRVPTSTPEADHRVLLMRLIGLTAGNVAYSFVLKSLKRTMTGFG